MKYCFFSAAVALFLFSPLLAFSDNSKESSSHWTHYVESADFNAKVIVLNDGSCWELIEGFEEGLVKETKKSKKGNKKRVTETFSHTKGYPLLQSHLWERGKQLKITPVYLDENGVIIPPRDIGKTHKKTPYVMFNFFVGEVASSMQPGTYIPSYVPQGPFVLSLNLVSKGVRGKILLLHLP
jgi:hypothetical protein